jgi:methylglutaconyl-CoA hydratase
MYRFLQYEPTGRICRITMDRPSKRNALHSGLIGELDQAFREAAADENVRVIILAGKGEAFSAGADLDELQDLQERTYAENLGDTRQLLNLYLRMLESSTPILAEIDGAAIAGGCGLVLCCDICYASDRASFGFPENRIGFIPALVSVLLMRRIGDLKAREMLLTGKLITASQAVEIGLVNAAGTTASMRSDILLTAEELSVKVSGQSVRKTKQLLLALSSLSDADGLALAAAVNAEVRSSEDCKRGVQAFLNKEKISW